MNRFRNRAISASAGTGKTFRLAHRYLGLLASDVSPDRICALTFSRKAAGEIFDKIVERLCLAATDPDKRAETAHAIAAEGLAVPADQPEAYVRLLRQFLDHEHRLRIGTLDSFILGVVRAFPLELGIPPDTQPMDGDGGEAQARRQAILTRLFDPTRWTGNEGEREGGTFLDDFRLACFGREAKSLASVLDGFIAKHYGFYREHDTAEWHWGDPTRIWPGVRWWEDPAVSAAALPADLPERLAEAFGSEGHPRKLGDACAKVAAAAMEHAANRPWPKLGGTVTEQLLAAAGRAEPPLLSYQRKGYPTPADLWPPLRRALANLVGIEVERALATTRGLRAVLDRYHRLYAEELSRDGRYTFDDLARLLGADGLNPGRTPLAPDRLYIDYRLDGKLDHWLLDEFQDTSDTQWAALRNLIDEVVQGEERSFFYVGDVKQSIYGWRGGNYRLFGDVLEEYRDLGPRAIAATSISACHRSLPAVIETVNRVFEGLADWTPRVGEGKGPRRGAVTDFAAVWQTHVSARRNGGEGFAALLEYGADEDATTAPAGDPGPGAGAGGESDEGAADPAEFRAVADVLREVWSPELTTAVLVRSNAAGRACADVLCSRLPGVPVLHEGKGGIVDHPVVTLLLALVRYAAHPGDLLALRHLQMSPLADEAEVLSPDALPGVLLAALRERGFTETLREWGGRLGDLDPCGRQRLRELLAAAERYDATGGRDPDAFADFIQAYQVKASAAAGTVRVMTIHQAKGLGFGLVIVPFSADAKSFEKPGDPDLLAGAGWVLEPPCQQAMAAAAGAPPQALDAARREANFAQLCVLYVALTRAEQALYMIIPAEKEKSRPTVAREADLVRERLAPAGAAGAGPGGLTQLYAAGDPAWFRRPGKGADARPRPARSTLRLTYATEVVRREPSKEHAEARAFPARWLFGSEAGNVRAFGSAIHRLFEKIEWIEDADTERLVSEWRDEAVEPAALLADVERQFRACLANPEVRRHLARPAGAPRAEVWREAPFNLVLESAGREHLVSGRFDRLVVVRNAANKPLRATVLDFKSNRVDSDADRRAAAEGYAGQMADYAQAAARLLDLPPAHVATVLLFTRTGRTWPG